MANEEVIYSIIVDDSDFTNSDNLNLKQEPILSDIEENVMANPAVPMASISAAQPHEFMIKVEDPVDIDIGDKEYDVENVDTYTIIHNVDEAVSSKLCKLTVPINDTLQFINVWKEHAHDLNKHRRHNSHIILKLKKVLRQYHINMLAEDIRMRMYNLITRFRLEEAKQKIQKVESLWEYYNDMSNINEVLYLKTPDELIADVIEDCTAALSSDELSISVEATARDSPAPRTTLFKQAAIKLTNRTVEETFLDLAKNQKGEENTSDSSNRRYECPSCTQKFTRQYHLTRHLKSHDINSRLKCEVCHKTFTRKENFKKHLVLHTQDYKCDTCSKTFTDAVVLTRHKKLHDQSKSLKPFECEICFRCFQRNSHLQDHRRVHTGEKPFKCQHNLCTQSFNRRHHLERHLSTHKK